MTTTNKNILITGGSGFIGTHLTQELLKRGCRVIVVDRSAPKINHDNLSFVKLDLTKEDLPKEYDGVLFAVVHLAGKSIFGRWTESFKKEAYDSRILSTKSLARSFSTWQEKPKVMVSASAFGYYGDKGDVLVTEEDSPGKDFGAGLCKDWEEEVQKSSALGMRTVQVRTANVLGQGGLLSPLWLPFKCGLGFYLGKGEGWFPWIHIEDIVALYLFAIENEKVSGPVNAAGEDYVTQKEFMKTFAGLMKTWAVVSIPIIFLFIRFGDFAFSFNNSVKMSSEKITGLGFVFKYRKLDTALRSIITK
jgi:uncharacterized protein (TIGR01777 family)